jgi:tRNA-uridine 2-sulfurtransferase
MSHVVVAMSGGVDSSVAAALLKEEGHRVIGVTLRLLKMETGFGCCGSTRDIEDARAVCASLDIPHFVMDFADDFKASVRDPFVTSYLAGETPNPCVACNRFIKFDALLKKAEALGADFVATGHYARVIRRDGRHFLARAADSAKDQSYVLHHLSQRELARLMFPVGDLAKPAVRALAEKHGLKTAAKKESMEICFVPGRDAAGYVKSVAPASTPTANPGPIMDSAGRLLGTHRGVAFYTRGQREGLGLSLGRPVYVVDLDADTNTMVVGSDEETQSKRFRVEDIVWTQGEPPSEAFEAEVQIRAHARPAPCVARVTPGRSAEVAALSPLRAVTPGQSAVFYDGDIVLGGGTIRRGEPSISRLPSPISHEVLA